MTTEGSESDHQNLKMNLKRGPRFPTTVRGTDQNLFIYLFIFVQSEADHFEADKLQQQKATLGATPVR